MKKIFISILIMFSISTIIFAGIEDTGNENQVISKENNPDFTSNTNTDKTVTKNDNTICPAIYDPVCAQIQIQCIKAPCNPIKETFSNSCLAKDNKILYKGECEKNDDKNDILEINKLQVDYLEDGGFSVNTGFKNNLKSDFKIRYFKTNNPNNINEMVFYNRNFVGTEIHPTYTIPDSKSNLNLESNTKYTIQITDITNSKIFKSLDISTKNIKNNQIDKKQKPLIHTSSDSSFSAKNGKPGQTCEQWLKEQNIQFYFLKTIIHENLLTNNFKEIKKSLNCIYKDNGKIIVEHYKKSPSPTAYPVTSAINRNSEGKITDQYFTRLGFNSKYYNSLTWENLDNIPDGKWGQNCYQWLEEKGFKDYEIRAYDIYGVLSPTICAYKIQKDGIETCTYAGAAGNFVELNQNNQKIKPVRYCDTNVLRINSQIAKIEKKPDLSIDDEEIISKCEVEKLNWISTNINNALSAEFEIITKNCNGETINIEILESDGILDDKIETIPIRIFDEKMNAKWNLKDVNDGWFGGEPEFYLKYNNIKSSILGE